jgi:hypothetical protein
MRRFNGVGFDMRRFTIEVDLAEYMDCQDWATLRKEAANEVLDDLLDSRGPVEAGVLGDLVDARAALLTKRYSEALRLLDRALSDWRYTL